MIKDLTGQVFGRLTVIELHGRTARRSILWLCKCACGKFTVSVGADMRHGKKLSCGCLRGEKSSQRAMARNTTHGKTHTPEYRIWQSMLKRCRNKNDPSYPRYGGRGIAVCKRWLSFTSFLADMGPRPSRGHSLDRTNGALNYTPDNCRWATRFEQQNNRGCTIFATIHGLRKPISDWCRELGLKYGTIAHRIFTGWPPERAVLEPIRKRTHRQPAHA